MDTCSSDMSIIDTTANECYMSASPWLSVTDTNKKIIGKEKQSARLLTLGMPLYYKKNTSELCTFDSIFDSNLFEQDGAPATSGELIGYLLHVDLRNVVPTSLFRIKVTYDTHEIDTHIFDLMYITYDDEETGYQIYMRAPLQKVRHVVDDPSEETFYHVDRGYVVQRDSDVTVLQPSYF